MKRYLLISFLFFAFLGCRIQAELEEKISNSEADTNTKFNALNSLQGSFSGCVTATYFPTYYSFMTITFDDDKLSFSETIGENADCSAPWYEYSNEWTITEATYVSGTSGAINITLSADSQGIILHHPWYVTQNYCSFTDWALGVRKDVTGLSCPLWFGGPGSFRDLGTLLFLEYMIDGDSFYYPQDSVSSGETADQRIKGSTTILTRD